MGIKKRANVGQKRRSYSESRKPTPSTPVSKGEREQRERSGENNGESMAPYNFVPLPDRVIAAQEFLDGKRPWEQYDMFAEGLLSGWIDLEITTETPTFIRCGPPAGQEEPRDPRKNEALQEFYHHGDPNRPVIPGSSIRGMVRNLFEIVTYGRLVYMNPFSEYGVSGGYLEIDGGEYYIRPSKTYDKGKSIVRISIRCHDGKGHDTSSEYGSGDIREAWIEENVLSRAPRDSNGIARIDSCKDHLSFIRKEKSVKLLIILSGRMSNRKYHSAILERDPEAARIRIPKQIWQLYQEDADRQGIRRLSARGGMNDLDSALFYIRDDTLKSDDNPDGLLFFGPTLMFIIPYSKKISDHIPYLRTQRDMTEPDLAQAVFGRVATNKDELTIRGRVMFLDAPWDGKGVSPFLEGGQRVPRILSSPKPTCFQHYLVQGEQGERKNWNDDTPLRGFKMYWHKRGVPPYEMFQYLENQPRTSTESTQETVIRPVREGITFLGCVKFDNLTPVELGALLTVLDLPSTMRHKIGMGKPLGMGTIRIRPKLTIIDRKKRYLRFFDDDGGLYEASTDATEKINQYKGEFEKKLNCLLSRAGSIWDIDRFKELACLLSWDGAPDYRSTQYLSPPSDTENVWKQRPILPRATEVCRSTRQTEQKRARTEPGSHS